MFTMSRRRTLGTLVVIAASVGTFTAWRKSTTTEPVTVQQPAYVVSGDSQSTTVVHGARQPARRAGT